MLYGGRGARVKLPGTPPDRVLTTRSGGRLWAAVRPSGAEDDHGGVAGDGGRRRVGRGDRLGAGRPQRRLEGVGAVVTRLEGVVRGQRGGPVRAGEVHRAGVILDRVVVGVQGDDVDRDGLAH